MNQFNKILAEVSVDPRAYAEDSFDASEIQPELPVALKIADLEFNFGAYSVDTKSMRVTITLLNNSVVAIDWMFDFPNESEVDVERWAEPTSISDAVTLRNFIIENKIFTISPRKGNLKAYEMVKIELSYSHHFVGSHQLPIIFKLRNGQSRAGKEVVINFRGYSIPRDEKYLHLETLDYCLESVFIGTSYPPIQSYRLENNGIHDIEYLIDMAVLEEFNAIMDYPILKCMNPKGVVRVGERTNLKFLFNPLDTRGYELDLPISVIGGLRRLLKIKGIGRSEHSIPIESVQITTLMDPEMMLCFSTEYINFSSVPLGSTSRKIMIATNKSMTDTMTIHWIVMEEAIKIIPDIIELKPLESLVFKIIFTPLITTAIYNLDIECKIPEQLTLLERVKSVSRPSTYRSSAKEGLRKYAKLPSIAPSTPSVLPGKLNPVTHFIAFKAESFDVQEFKGMAGSSQNFFTERKITEMDLEVSIILGSAEKEILKDVLTSMLGDIFQEEDVQMLPEVLSHEDIPYYIDHRADLEDKLLLPEFINFAETVLEGTLYNLMQEIDAGEFVCTEYPMLFETI